MGLHPQVFTIVVGWLALPTAEYSFLLMRKRGGRE